MKQGLLVDEIVESENLVENIVVESAQDTSNHTNQDHRENIQGMVANSDATDIKQDEATFPKEPTLPRAAKLHESSEHHHHNRGAKEGPP